MNTHKRYPKEVREKAIRMVQDHQSEYNSQWAAITSIAGKLGMTPETLRAWLRAAENAGDSLVTGFKNAERIKELERENKELKRSNEILKSAATFFAAELDRPSK
jgi:transposase-like protein